MSDLIKKINNTGEIKEEQIFEYLTYLKKISPESKDFVICIGDNIEVFNNKTQKITNKTHEIENEAAKNIKENFKIYNKTLLKIKDLEPLNIDDLAVSVTFFNYFIDEELKKNDELKSSSKKINKSDIMLQLSNLNFSFEKAVYKQNKQVKL